MSQDMTESTRVMPASGMPGADKTMVAPQGFGAGAAPGATQMGATVSCAVCGTNSAAMETYCVECGFLLASAPGALETAEPAETGPELVEHVTGRRFRLKTGVNTVGRENCDILLMDGTVSRRHAQVSVENGAIVVTDLGSTNGTQVSGARIGPNQPTPLPQGATVRFGNATLTLPAAGPAEATIFAPPAEPALAVQVDAAPDALSEPSFMESPVEPAAAESAPPIAFGAAPPSEEPPIAFESALVAEQPPVAGSLPAAGEASTSGPTPAVARLRSTFDGGRDLDIHEGSTTIGRRAGNTYVIDGDPYVSGRHADIICDNTGCYLVDVGSTNGTTVNGARLDVGEKQLLLDGDEIGLGQGTYAFETLEPPEEPARPLGAPAGDLPFEPMPMEGEGQ